MTSSTTGMEWDIKIANLNKDGSHPKTALVYTIVLVVAVSERITL